MKNPWLWAAVLGAGYLFFVKGATKRADAPQEGQEGDLPPPPDVYGVDEYGMPMKPGEPLVDESVDEGVQLAEHIWGYSKVPTLDQFRKMNLGRGY